MDKRPWYKSGYKCGIIFLVLGIITTITIGTPVPALLGIIVLFVTPIKRLFSKKKDKSSGLQGESRAKDQKTTSKPATVQDAVTPPASTVESHRVAGTSYHREEIEALGDYNNCYDMSAADLREIYDKWDKVYEYTFYSVDSAELVPEPDNEYDTNAIRVEVKGHHIGYIKKGSTAHIRKLMSENRIVKVGVEIGGGKYKQLDDEKHVTKNSTEYYAKLSIKTVDK